MDNLFNPRGSDKSHVQTSHQGSITCFQVKEREDVLITGSSDKTVKFWKKNKNDWDCIKTLTTHQGPIMCLKSNERYLVTGSTDGTIKVWEKYKHIQTLKGHKGAITCLKIMMIGYRWMFGYRRVIFSGSNDHTIRVWQKKSDQFTCQQVLTGHQKRINALAFSIHKLLLYTASADNTIKIWEGTFNHHKQIPMSFRYVETLHGHNGPVTSLYLIPFRGFLFSASQDRTIKIWKKGKCLKSYQTSVEYLSHISLKTLLNKKILLAASCDTITLFNVDSNYLELTQTQCRLDM